MTKKTQFWSQFGPIWPKFGPTSFFIKNLASSVTRCYGQLSSCTISEKTNDSILRKLSDGRTDGQTDRRTRVISQDAVRLTSSVQNWENCLFKNKKKFLKNWNKSNFSDDNLLHFLKEKVKMANSDQRFRYGNKNFHQERLIGHFGIFLTIHQLPTYFSRILLLFLSNMNFDFEIEI